MKNMLYKVCLLGGDRSNRSISDWESVNVGHVLRYRLGKKTSGIVGPLFTYNNFDAAQQEFREWASIQPAALIGVEWEPVTELDVSKYIGGFEWTYSNFWRRYFEEGFSLKKVEFPESVTLVRSVTPVVLIDHTAPATAGWTWNGKSYYRIPTTTRLHQLIENTVATSAL